MIKGHSTLITVGLGVLLASLAGCGGGSSDAKETVALMSKRNTTVTSEVIKATPYSLFKVVLLDAPGGGEPIQVILVDP